MSDGEEETRGCPVCGKAMKAFTPQGHRAPAGWRCVTCKVAEYDPPLFINATLSDPAAPVKVAISRDDYDREQTPLLAWVWDGDFDSTDSYQDLAVDDDDDRSIQVFSTAVVGQSGNQLRLELNYNPGSGAGNEGEVRGG